MALPLDAVLEREGAQAAPTAGAAPERAPMEMPVQNLGARPPSRKRRFVPMTVLTRLFVFGGGAIITAWGAREMYRAVEPGNLTGFEIAFLVAFVPAFGWIALSATAALAGLLYRARPAAPPSTMRTALVMPIYNEDSARVGAALLAMAEDLHRSGREEGFEIFLLSDSTDPNVWVREIQVADALRRGSPIPVWYRRRTENSGKKAGNIKQFIQNWGGRYDAMLVLDADSMMSGATMLALRDRLAAEPDLALLQTSPALAGRLSLFARMQQFASRVHGPAAARGVAVWSGDSGNFWGHNAIIRVDAFAQSCGLPDLPGRRPFGGAIMSHDFVEAALLRRRGWKVHMAAEMDGSWEESPPSLLDAAARDRRWAQGNLQHAGVVTAEGFTGASKGHFLIGIMSYLASPLWLLLLVTGVILSVQARLAEPDYFTEAFDLFPNWPRFDAERMLGLFAVSMVVLLTPKLIGLARGLLSPAVRRGCGGAARLAASWVVELFLSALYAPVMLLIQCQQLLEILTGRDSGWSAQQREEMLPGWDMVIARHGWHSAVGVIGGIGAFAISPAIFLWLSPTLAGMVLAPVLSRISASRGAGMALRRAGLLRIPEETARPPLFGRRDEILAVARAEQPDELRALARDASLRGIYLDWAKPRAIAPRGQADLDLMSAAKKIGDARTLDEALSWLTAADRRAALGSPDLVRALANLPDADQRGRARSTSE